MQKGYNNRSVVNVSLWHPKTGPRCAHKRRDPENEVIHIRDPDVVCPLCRSFGSITQHVSDMRVISLQTVRTYVRPNEILQEALHKTLRK